jgi:hypothetical protein
LTAQLRGSGGRQGGAGDGWLIRHRLWPPPHKFAEAGAITIICARDQTSWTEACKEAEAGKDATVITYAADIADMSKAATAGGQLLETTTWRRGHPHQQRWPLHPPRH